MARREAGLKKEQVNKCPPTEKVNYKRCLGELLKDRRMAAPRYEEMQCFEPEERRMGYHAPSFKCKVVVKAG